MDEAFISLRSAVSEDADAVARIFLGSAEYHARLDPERYSVPELETISARRRERQVRPESPDCITLVVEVSGEIVGFIDARFEPVAGSNAPGNDLLRHH
jgi:hypothetical protein